MYVCIYVCMCVCVCVCVCVYICMYVCELCVFVREREREKREREGERERGVNTILMARKRASLIDRMRFKLDRPHAHSCCVALVGKGRIRRNATHVMLKQRRCDFDIVGGRGFRCKRLGSVGKPGSLNLDRGRMALLHRRILDYESKNILGRAVRVGSDIERQRFEQIIPEWNKNHKYIITVLDQTPDTSQVHSSFIGYMT